MADIKVNELPTSTPALTDKLFGIGASEEYQAEISGVANVVLKNYSNSSLETTSKNVVGAINELNDTTNRLEETTNEILTGANEVISEATKNWLDENVTPTGSAVVVDSSLKVDGAAADSKTVGDKFDTIDETLTDAVNDLKSDINNIGNAVGLTVREATNLLGVHGNFENFAISATNWYTAYNESTASVTDNILSFDANRQYGSIRHLFPVTLGHKYYFFSTIKTASPYVTVSINVETPLVSCPNDNDYHYISGIFDTFQSSVDKAFCIVNSSSVANQSTVYAQKCGVIDLTETFGSGNEPTKAQVDEAMHLIGDFLVNGTLIIKGTEEETLHVYEGKKILFMGDSITAANLNNNGWCKYFNEIMNPSKSVNIAVSGATWSDKEDTVYDGNPVTTYQANNTIGNQVEKIARGKDTSNPNYTHVADYDDFDIIIISAGTNDGYSKFNTENIKPSIVDLTWQQPLPYTSIDTKNAVGAMVYAYERLYTMYPNAKYFYCTPIQTYPSKKEWGESQHKGDVMKATGDYIPPIIIDTEKCGIFGNQEQYSTEGVNLYDGLHPNANGARKIGVYNANAIIKTYLALDS